MTRWRFTPLRFLRAAGLGLFVISAGLFALSVPFTARARDDRVGMVELFAGRLEFSPRQGLIDLYGADPGAPIREFRIGRAADAPQWGTGFVWWFDIDGAQEVSRTRALPLWVPACAGLLGFAAGVLPRVLRGGRDGRAECTRCAYDLRGLRAGAPCPECGKG